MNQEKIGKFIAEIRKEKNMTQLDLAGKLGITDRAISKWENGRGLPDLSLIKPLCDELEITINELLSGEKIKKENYQERLEENILNTIIYSDEKMKQNGKRFKIVLISIVVIVSMFIALFVVDIYRMNNRLPVLFSTWGFKYAPPIDLHEEEIEIAIEKYILSNSNPKNEGEKSFTSFKTYLIDEKSKTLYYVYAWVLEESYYLDNNEIIQESGSSIPHKFVVELKDDKYVVTDSIIPRDGSYYVKDMKNIFPYFVRREMDNVHSDGTIEKLQIEIDKQVNLYFK